MPRRYPQFRRTWPAYAVSFGTILIGLVFAPIIPFDDPWPISLMIALFALLLLVWIPMIIWIVGKRKGIVWSVRDLSGRSDAKTHTARLALWNSGYVAIRPQPGATDEWIALRIEGRDPATTIVAITAVPTSAKPLRFNIRLSPDHRQAELTTDEIAIRSGVIFNVEHTGAHGSDLVVTGDSVTYFPPGDVVIVSNWNELLKHPVAIVGVLILLLLALFWLHEGQTALTLALHSVIMGLVIGTISGLVAIIFQTRANHRKSERSMMKLVGLPVGLERFFENG